MVSRCSSTLVGLMASDAPFIVVAGAVVVVVVVDVVVVVVVYVAPAAVSWLPK